MSALPVHLERFFTRFQATKPRPLGARRAEPPITRVAAHPALAGEADHAAPPRPDRLPLGVYDLTAF